MRRSASTVFLAVVLAAVCYATLAPVIPTDVARLGRVRWHPVPGDLLRNFLLFVPLGAACVARGIRQNPAVAGSLALSVGIELAQLAIPGRYSSPWDVLANMTGAGVGIGIARHARCWLAPSRAAAYRLCLAAGALTAGWLLLASWLLAPSPPPGTYFAHWAPSLPSLYPIDASVRAASLDGSPLPEGWLTDSGGIRRELAGDFELRVAAIAGRPTAGLAPLLWLTNQHGRDVFLVGVERSDLILRWPARGAAFGLDTAPLRLPGFFDPLPQGTPFELLIARRDAGTCVTRGASRACGLGVTAGDGWRVLAPDLRLPPRAREGLAAVWLGGLWLPIGFWFAPTAGPLAALTAAGAATLFTPRFGSLLPTPPLQLGAAALGFAIGCALQRARRAYESSAFA